jgi:hypothetical protein
MHNLIHPYGKIAAVPVTAPAWNNVPRQLNGIASIVRGAQLPGRS